MILSSTFRKRITEVLKDKFPDIPVYGFPEVSKGYRVPCFFVGLTKDMIGNGAINAKGTLQRDMDWQITYLIKDPKEEDLYMVSELLKKAFSEQDFRNRYGAFILHIEDRYVEVKNLSFTLAGGDYTEMVATLSLSFKDDLEYEDDTILMEHVYTDLNYEKEAENGV